MTIDINYFLNLTHKYKLLPLSVFCLSYRGLKKDDIYVLFIILICRMIPLFHLLVELCYYTTCKSGELTVMYICVRLEPCYYTKSGELTVMYMCVRQYCLCFYAFFYWILYLTVWYVVLIFFVFPVFKHKLALFLLFSR